MELGLKRAFIVGAGNTPSPPPAVPRDYYISAAGTGDGLTSGTPAPISILSSAVWVDGDQIFLNRGDTFYLGALVIDAPNIIIDAYGSGANPIVIGSTVHSANTFTDNGDGTWYTTVTGNVKWVTEGDVLLRLAESAWIPITVSASTTTRRVLAATVNAFPSSVIGATIIAKEWSFRTSQPATVTNYNSGNGDITFTNTTGGWPTGSPAVGMPLKFYNQKQFMTVASDWFYDIATSRLYIKSVSNPAGRDFHVIREDYGIHLSYASGVEIRNIDFKHYQNYAILVEQSANFVLEDFHIHATRGDAIRTLGNNTSNLIIQNGEIDNHAMRGIEIGAVQTGLIFNVHLHDIGTQLNVGYPFDVHATGGTAITPLIDAAPIKLPNNITIDDCTIEDVGYQGIQVFGRDWIITNTLIDTYCLKWSDGGGVHAYYANGFLWSTSNLLLQHCIIKNGIGNTDGIASGAVTTLAAIYFDAGINNCTADNNVVLNPGKYSMFCNNWNTGHIITNNIFESGSEFCLQIWGDFNPNVNYPYNLVQNVVCTGNIMAVTTAAARCISLLNPNGNAAFNPFVTLNTNHYVNPYNVNVASRSSNNGSLYTDNTLAQWATFTGLEGSSTSMTNYKGGAPDADDIMIEENPTNSAVNFNTPAGYVDYNNGAFSNPVSIPAWYGLMYFQRP